MFSVLLYYAGTPLLFQILQNLICFYSTIPTDQWGESCFETQLKSSLFIPKNMASPVIKIKYYSSKLCKTTYKEQKHILQCLYKWIYNFLNIIELAYSIKGWFRNNDDIFEPLYLVQTLHNNHLMQCNDSEWVLQFICISNFWYLLGFTSTTRQPSIIVQGMKEES